MDRRLRVMHDAIKRALLVEPLEARCLLSGDPLLESAFEETSPNSEDIAPLADTPASPVADAVPVVDIDIVPVTDTVLVADNVPALESSPALEIVPVFDSVPSANTSSFADIPPVVDMGPVANISPELDAAPIVDVIPVIDSPSFNEIVPIGDIAPQMEELPPKIDQSPPPINDIPAFLSDAAQPAAPETTVAVEVVELGVALPAVEAHLPIAQSELPQTIVDAVDALFPGAELVEAKLSAENGTAVYGVSTEFEGRPIDVTLTDDGNILDTAYTLTPSEVPQPVQDWVEENFPGALIGTAQLVTQSDGVSYDLMIATGEGEYFEATVRLQNVKTPRGFVAKVIKLPGDARATAPTDSEAPPTNGSTVAEETTTDAALDPTSSAAAVADKQSHSNSTAIVPEDGQPTQQAKVVLAAALMEQLTPEQLSAGDATPQPEPIAGADLTERFSQAAGAISDLIPIDMAALDESLLQLLDEVDGLLDTVVEGAVGRNLITGSALAAALVASARVIVLESRKRKLEPVLVSSAGNSTWGWLLATANPPCK